MHSNALTTYTEHRGPQVTSAELATVLMGRPQSGQLPTDDLVDSTANITAATAVQRHHPALTTLATTETLFPAPEPTRPVVVLPLTSSTERFHLLQLWEGVVQEVREDSILVTLVDQTHRDYPDEEAELVMAEIPEGDRALVVPGAVLYWSVGYKEGPGQPRERISRIRLRRLPAWNKTDLDRARVNAQELARLLEPD